MSSEAHWLARGHTYSTDEVPLYRLAEEVAESLTAARPGTWRKDGANNGLRADIAKAMQTVGCGGIVNGVLENFRALMREGRIRPRHPFGGLPAASPELLALEYFVSEAEATLIRDELIPRSKKRKSPHRTTGKSLQPSETVPERNLRWYETYQLTEARDHGPRGAHTRAARKIAEDEGVTEHAARKGLQAGERLHLVLLKEGGAKTVAPKANSWCPQPEKTGKSRR